MMQELCIPWINGYNACVFDDEDVGFVLRYIAPVTQIGHSHLQHPQDGGVDCFADWLVVKRFSSNWLADLPQF